MSNHEHQGHEHTEGQSSCCANHSNDGRKSDAGYDVLLDKPVARADSASLDELKNEILSSINKEKRAPLSWNSLTVSVVLGVLAVISLVQVIQTASLYNKLKSGDLKPSTVAPASGAGSSLPSQVGGC